MYYLRLSETYKEDIISGQVLKKSSLVKECEINTYICKSTFKEKLQNKLSAAEFKLLEDNKHYNELCEKVNNLP
jgi:hypothetical protein